MLVLVGFMGAGKTTVGRLLGTRLDVPFLDSDHVIEARAGRPIPEIFASEGEPAFRALEHEVIADLLAGPPAVLALGGGAVQAEKTRKLLASVPVVFLRITFAEALARVGGDGYRPVLARPDITEVYESRQESYAEVATVTVDVDGRRPAEITEDVLARLAELPSAPGMPRPRPLAVAVPVAGSSRLRLAPSAKSGPVASGRRWVSAANLPDWQVAGVVRSGLRGCRPA